MINKRTRVLEEIKINMKRKSRPMMIFNKRRHHNMTMNTMKRIQVFWKMLPNTTSQGSYRKHRSNHLKKMLSMHSCPDFSTHIFHWKNFEKCTWNPCQHWSVKFNALFRGVNQASIACFQNTLWHSQTVTSICWQERNGTWTQQVITWSQ